MKPRLIVSLALAVIMVAFVSVPALAAVSEEGSVSAGVTVQEWVNITITDQGTTGINFGSVDPATTDNPDGDQSDSLYSISIAVESETNVDIDLGIKGTDFIETDWTVDNAKYSKTYAGAKTALSTTYAEFAGDVTPGSTQDLWHWLNVPSGTEAGTYSSTFSYKAVKADAGF